ncbi:MAG TPA: ribulose-phosphate 3-epimerase [Planctomycetaceae bacterium]|nr:ribulose-phosphate 3-epimerase [Planctomycetaceae bacterium]
MNTRANRALETLRGSPQLVLPSLLQCDFGNLASEIERLEAAGIRALHLDVMDGHFVPNLTYGMPIVAGLRRRTEMPLDVHLMISRPSRYIQQFVDAGADLLTIHCEIEEPVDEVLDQIRETGIGVGLAANPDTAYESFSQHLAKCDLFLPMSVNAGFGGQEFNPVALDKLRAARADHPHLLLEVDGGVNLSTIADCADAGATLMVVGSAIFGQSDYGTAIDGLLAKLN